MYNYFATFFPVKGQSHTNIIQIQKKLLNQCTIAIAIFTGITNMPVRISHH